MKAIVSIVFGLALLLSQVVVTLGVPGDSGNASGACCKCACKAQKMSCCVAPASNPAPQPLSTVPASRGASTEGQLLYVPAFVQQNWVTPLSAGKRPVPTVSLLSSAADLPIFLRHCSFLI